MFIMKHHLKPSSKFHETIIVVLMEYAFSLIIKIIIYYSPLGDRLKLAQSQPYFLYLLSFLPKIPSLSGFFVLSVHFYYYLFS